MESTVQTGIHEKSTNESRCFLSLLVFFCGCGLPVSASAASQSPTNTELQKQLQERDAIIDDLLHRVRLLENKANQPASATGKVTSVPTQSQSVAAQERPSASKKTKSGSASGGAGSFEVDEKTAIRALERTLTTQGALLLPAWGLEIQPSFSYSRANQKEAFLRVVGEDPLVGNLEQRSDSYTFGIQGRLGLPFDSQFELYLPLRMRDQSLFEPVGFIDKSETQTTAWSLGDLSIGFAKTLLREKNWWPDLIGRVTWDSHTGRKTKNGISLGDGYHELEGSLTAIKRLDPLALFTVINYQRAFENDNYKPGDQYGISLGVSMATSPETSINAIFQQSFVLENIQNGKKTVGSDQSISLLSLGVSWTVGRGSLLSISPTIGLSEDAPDYAATVSWSYRVQ